MYQATIWRDQAEIPGYPMILPELTMRVTRPLTGGPNARDFPYSASKIGCGGGIGRLV